jgi:arylsulfatase A-like enzyme
VAHLSDEKQMNERRGKSTLYDEAVRVPLLMKLPHLIPAETSIDHPVSLLGKSRS